MSKQGSSMKPSLTIFAIPSAVRVRVRVRVRLTLTLILTLTRRARLGGHRLDAARVGPRRQEAQDQVDGLPHRGRHQQGRLGRRQHRRHRRLGRVHQDLDRLSPSERGSRRGRRAPYAPRRGTRGRCGDRRHLDDIQGRADVIEHMHPPRRTAHGVCRASFLCGLDESEKAVDQEHSGDGVRRLLPGESCTLNATHNHDTTGAERRGRCR